jgi:hypothetical protein
VPPWDWTNWGPPLWYGDSKQANFLLLAGLDRLLAHARGWLSGEGQELLDSLDARVADNPKNLAYREANRRAGRYIGEVRMHLESQGQKGAPCGWLHVDAETLKRQAAKAGWNCEVILTAAGGDYLARLTEGRTALQGSSEEEGC